jgi:hypothetical protein
MSQHPFKCCKGNELLKKPCSIVVLEKKDAYTKRQKASEKEFFAKKKKRKETKGIDLSNGPSCNFPAVCNVAVLQSTLGPGFG